jgi:hypothetical protein
MPSSSRPHVLLVLTDQQSLWTISAYHRLLRDGGYASAADFGVGRAPAWAPLPTPHIDALAAGGAIFANFVRRCRRACRRLPTGSRRRRRAARRTRGGAAAMGRACGATAGVGTGRKEIAQRR